MAWFNPPLYKLGNKNCPNCGHPSGWWDWGLGSWAWSKWNCPKCQSVLGIDLGRRAAQAVVVGVPFALVLILGEVHTWSAWAKVSFLVGWLIFFVLAGWWFHSWVLRRPAKEASRAL